MYSNHADTAIITREPEETPLDPAVLWAKILVHVREKVDSNIFDLWMRSLQIEGVEGDTIMLSVPQRFLKGWIERHHTKTLLASCQSEVSTVKKVAISVRSIVLKKLLKTEDIAVPTQEEKNAEYAQTQAAEPAPAPEEQKNADDIISMLNWLVASALLLEVGVPEQNIMANPLAEEGNPAQYAVFAVPEEVLLSVAKELGKKSGKDVYTQLKGLLDERRKGSLYEKPVLIRQVQDVVLKANPQITREDLLSTRRTNSVVILRQIAMYLAKTMTHRSMPEIGRQFGGRDHTTVLHSVQKIERLIPNDPKLAEQIESLKRAVREFQFRNRVPLPNP